MNNAMLQSALHYHSEGLCVIPVKNRDKAPALETWEEYQTRCSTKEEVTEWFSNGNGYNLGIVHGEVSGGYIAFDVDKDNGVFADLIANFEMLRNGRIEQSGSGKGFHIPMRVDRFPDFGTDKKHKRPRGNRTWKTAKGDVNIRCRYCQTLAPPSIHPTGNRYKFIQKNRLVVAQNIDSVVEYLNTLAPPPVVRRTGIPARPVSPANKDSLIDAVLEIYPTSLAVFRELGYAGSIATERTGELRLLGNGGLLVTEDEAQWYCFSDEMGGGPFEAWGWHKFGSSYDSQRHFRTVLLEMAQAAGIDAAKFYRRGDEDRTQRPPVVDRYWSKQFEGYWERVR